MKIFLIGLFVILIIIGVLIASWKGYKNFSKMKNVGKLSDEEKKNNEILKKRGTKGVVIGTIIAVASLFTMICVPCAMYEVQSGEIAVVKTYGQVKDTKTAGLHMRNIFTQSYNIYDTKVQQVKLEKWVYVLDNSTGTNITQAIQVVSTIQFQINEAMVKQIAIEYGTLDALTSRVETVILGTLETEAGGFNLNVLLTGVGKKDYQDNVKTALKNEEVNYYLTFRQVTIEEFVLEPELEAALMRIRLAEAERKAAEEKYAQETAKVIAEAKQAEERAKGEAAAAKAKAQGDADALEIITAAEAAKIIEIAKAEAEAISLKLVELNGADAATLAYLEYLAWVERWDGKLPQTMLGDGIGIFLPGNP